MKKNFLLFIYVLFAAVCCNTISANKPVVSSNGMVISAHPLASEAGIEILKKGGNAVDAAVAMEFALAVVFPDAGNIGGGGFMIYRSSDGGVDALDYREVAPLKGHRDMYLDKNGDVIPDKSVYGTLASGVPGTVDGMVKAHKKYGKLDWSVVLEPAIKLAEKGFKITVKQADDINMQRELFIKYNPKGITFVKEKNWKEGDLLVQTDLAKTLKLIRDKGRDGFYKGETADLIVSQMKESGGIISHKDLEEYNAVWRTPIVGSFQNYKVISMPPPSSGGIALASLLSTIEPYPISEWGFQEEKTIQLMVEAQRRVYADRATYLGDPDFWDVPQKQLLDKSYLKQKMSDISFEKATPSTDIKPTLPGWKESPQTTHYCVVDKDRNAVSATTTLNDWFGSRVMVNGAGFLLNDQMDDFSAKPGTPNIYGLVGGEANAIQPQKRMLSSMTPTILEKDCDLYMVVGTPGGSTIITSVFQTILNITQFGMNAQEAVSKPRFHHQWLPDDIQVEDNAISEKVRNALKAKGYKITPRESWGRVEAIVVEGNRLEGGADPRGDDKAVGY